ncbi:unnamed protein product, partial [Brachionus calyciflorus]
GLFNSTDKNQTECIMFCRSRNLPRSIISNKTCFCSSNTYEIIGLDYSNALCNFDSDFLGGGSEYYLKINVSFELNDISISKCSTLCDLSSSKYIALMNNKCFCLYSSLKETLFVKSSVCEEQSSRDFNYIDNDLNNYSRMDQYIINEMPYFEQNNGINADQMDGCYNISTGQMITDATLEISECINLCSNLNYMYAGIMKNLFLCGNKFNYSSFNDSCYKIYKIFKNENFEKTTKTDETTSESLLSTNNIENIIEKISYSTKTDQTTSQKSLKEDFKLLNDEEVIDFVSSVDYDITGCLSNCSNQGNCKLINQKFQCSCDQHHYGSSCNIARKYCKVEKKCLNSGTCIDLIKYNTELKSYDYDYKCICSENFYGSNCENEVDLCSNLTCSSNGECVLSSLHEPKCKCFQLYSGENCEIKSLSLIVIQNVRITSSVIAIIIIILLFLYIIANDLILINFVCFKPKNHYINQKNKDIIYKYEYKSS